MSQGNRIVLGTSSCLLGEKVRYDGGHKQHHYITDVLSRHFSFISVCPETECGMTVPRKALRLIGEPDNPKMVTVLSGEDSTICMNEWCARRITELKDLSMRGFIFKKNSPSCGLFRVKVYRDKGSPATGGRGLFANAIIKAFPLLPVEEEGRLADARLRENFIERVYSYDRLLNMLAAKPGKKELIRFHTVNKLLLLAHSPEHYRRMGKLVADAVQLQDLLPLYSRLFMEGLSLIATPSKQSNVLMHCMGYFKKGLEKWEKQEMTDLIERYRTGQIPLIVPVTILKHYIRRFGESYLAEQLYFNPHPDELMLRNHV